MIPFGVGFVVGALTIILWAAEPGWKETRAWRQTTRPAR
jgi:hypothetical protein